MTLGQTILVLALYLLAVMRVVRMINHDTVLDWARVWIATRAATADAAAGEAFAANQPILATGHNRRNARWNTLVYFLGCPWCVGMWLALATAILPVLVIGWPWWALFPTAFATSQIVGMLAPLSADDEIDFEPVQ